MACCTHGGFSSRKCLAEKRLARPSCGSDGGIQTPVPPRSSRRSVTRQGFTDQFPRTDRRDWHDWGTFAIPRIEHGSVLSCRFRTNRFSPARLLKARIDSSRLKELTCRTHCFSKVKNSCGTACPSSDKQCNPRENGNQKHCFRRRRRWRRTRRTNRDYTSWHYDN